MRFLKITLAYEGTAYAGWQVQPQQATVQAALEEAWRRLTGESVRAVASGRTDAGVHALAQVASLQTTSQLSDEVLCQALNAHLAEDIRIHAVETAAEGFHALRDATSKRYRYLIQDGPTSDPFCRRFAWRIRQRLDAVAMHQAAQWLKGKHDFSSFEAAGARRRSSVRTITDILVARRDSKFSEKVMIEVQADGFLYNMVRNMVGSLVEVGRGNRPPQWIQQVLTARDRKLAGMTAPPHGLLLLRVDYAPTAAPVPGGERKA